MANKIVVYVGDQWHSSSENAVDTGNVTKMSKEQDLFEPQSTSPNLDRRQCEKDSTPDNNGRRGLEKIIDRENMKIIYAVFD